MLKTRVITALGLLAILLPILYLHHTLAFAVVVTALFGAAVWETMRLFRPEQDTPLMGVINFALAAAFFVYVGFLHPSNPQFAMGLAAFLWLMKFTPSLAIGLPAFKSFANTLLSIFYFFALVGCFLAIIALFQHSSLYLLSVMVIVWAADIGAYFSGKAFGKRKLAPSISPGKSWEGAIGGLLIVLVLAVATVLFGGTLLADSFVVRLQAAWGWIGLVGVLSLLVAFSVAGDLFESQLKRRAGRKDSSSLLPGHGGVLDRIDALIPVLPMAALITTWL
ncbi:phosphatidate cytidylyltransferase [Massilia sp. TS11]|uniref:phosphatidate cytidylyltransferase n=1 Tax=Massilia sp. TS11 TaxID=2908003 RepID=UPI001EDC161A|nr:phosphatidate cytidylyltransferase [Massilia sp. TS11]MCG2584088.1 phosphatidate cytidylyltransferase [Massilia sp. TS11]